MAGASLWLAKRPPEDVDVSSHTRSEILTLEGLSCPLCGGSTHLNSGTGGHQGAGVTLTPVATGSVSFLGAHLGMEQLSAKLQAFCICAQTPGLSTANKVLAVTEEMGCKLYFI